MRVYSLFLICFFCAAFNLRAQPVKIAVLAPVYLDSAFAGENYRLGKNSLPKYILPGLDYYHGVMLAIDSLNIEKAPIEVLFYDTKSISLPIEHILADPQFQDVSLIIASFNSRNEIRPVADFARTKNILLISSTYPNDGGVNAHPGFVLLNPTLTAHIESVYRFVHRTYPLDPIILFRRRGAAEDRIQAVFNSMNKKTPGLPLKIKTAELPDSFTNKQVTDLLDSTRRNIVICGTLDEAFGLSLTKAISSNKAYRTIAIGMPTWDALRDISNGLEVVYTTPYNYTRQDKLSISLSEKYRLKYSGRPSDMVFKGFESMYRFSKLVLTHGKDLGRHLSDKEYTLFNSYDIQPVYNNGDAQAADYLENKKLYIIHRQDGRIKSVN